MFAPKPKKKYEPIKPVNLKLNLSNKKSTKTLDPKNPGQTISKQSLDLRDRNIYTGKLQKNVYKGLPKKK